MGEAARTGGGLAAGLVLLLAGAAAAEDLAVIVRNEAYRDVRDAETGIDLARLSGALGDKGFAVETIENATAADLQARFFRIRTAMEEADRLILVIAGHVVTNGRDAWLLGTDAGRVSVFDAGSEGLPLSVLDGYLAEKPGSAMLLVASPGSQQAGSGLVLGYLPGEVAQGVTVLAGPGAALSEILADDILGAGLPVGQALAEREGGEVAAYGFLPRHVTFLPAASAGAADAAGGEDEAAWQAAALADSEAAYEDYLERFRNGRHAGEARTRLGEMRPGPEAQAAAAEDALVLDRETRREVQRTLTLLGYDTRGIDGIFGRGTRTALGGWQQDEGLEATGYLTSEQVALLREMGGARQSDLEAEAARRQEEADRADRAFWKETGTGGTGEGLRRYLARYPDGRFSEEARRRLATLGAENGGAPPPDAPEEDGGTAARAEEARILVNPVTRLLVERRLQQLGLEPGEADGTFDEETRKAIRNYQRARNLAVTGFVDQPTLVRLLAG